MKRFAKLGNSVFILCLLVLLFQSGYTQEQTEQKPKLNDNNTNSIYMNSRKEIPAYLKKSSEEDIGWKKYVRAALHDGNLVTTGLVNQGQLSGGYIENVSGMRWPKGSNQVGYGYVFNFFVAGEVTDIHGNTVHIVSDRFARSPQVSSDLSHYYYFFPVPGYYNDHHSNSEDWETPGISEDVGVDGIPNSGDAGENDGILQPAEDVNSNGVLDLSLINEVEWFAMSHRKETWPVWWPVGSYEGDDREEGEERPGPAAGRWNGEYGYYARSDQESYYAMDDHENDEFEYYPFNYEGTDIPDTTAWPNCRRGLGVTVEVRNYQWSALLAEDILISIYDVTNYGKRLDKTVIGMYCDADVGSMNQSNLASYDEIDDITYVWDKFGIASNGLPTGYFGYAFLESPGLPNNGVDDDEDGMVDESQYDGIDNDGDWRSWIDSNNNGMYDTEDSNYNGMLDAGEDLNGNGMLDREAIWDDIGSDGLGPEHEGYTGPDADGTEANGIPDAGEPNFEHTDNDESDQVGLTSWVLRAVNSRMANDDEFWRVELIPGTFQIEPGYTGDISWTYGCGYVPIETGKSGTQRYAIACLFGNDEQDIFRNKRTMQLIYDSDYNFAKPPRKPNLAAVGADNKVILTWDNLAEQSRDPIYGNDFEGYKIYKSTDPAFDDIKTITDAFNNPLFYQPLVQFDLVDSLFGAHPITLGGEGGTSDNLGIAYNMGTDSGLRHFYVDTSVTNGRTYYYAVVSYDKGYDTDFYERGLSDRENLQRISPTECSKIIQTDELGRPIFFDQNCVEVIPMEPVAGYVDPIMESGMEHVSGFGTGNIALNIVNPYDININHEYALSFTDDSSLTYLNGDGDSLYFGLTTSAIFTNLTTDDTLFKMSDDFTRTATEDLLVEGMNFTIQFDLNSDGEIESPEYDHSEWIIGNCNLNDTLTSLGGGKAIPRDFEVRVLEMGADTSLNNVATNYQIWDITDPNAEFQVPYRLNRNNRVSRPDSLKGYLGEEDNVWLYAQPEIQNDGSIRYKKKTWRLWFHSPPGADSTTEVITPQSGDILRIYTKKPFDRQDVFKFKMVGNEVQKKVAQNDLDDIYTVPNPYIAVSTLERKLYTDAYGRGDRRIDFVNLPSECTIKIFTVAGRLVREINHSSSVDQGREKWDLRTKDGLEVSAGYYFYHIDAPGIGEKTGKLAIIK
ncbi:hypothetical protein GF337_04560 [candidate division KSB1 bacterium]|nr:hypothetical protein [candidate division KSB1 bacterium]